MAVPCKAALTLAITLLICQAHEHGDAGSQSGVRVTSRVVTPATADGDEHLTLDPATGCFDVRGFGALGDGVTDDTSAFNAGTHHSGCAMRCHASVLSLDTETDTLLVQRSAFCCARRRCRICILPRGMPCAMRPTSMTVCHAFSHPRCTCACSSRGCGPYRRLRAGPTRETGQWIRHHAHRDSAHGRQTHRGASRPASRATLLRPVNHKL